MKNRASANKIFDLLKKNYPNAKCELIYNNPFELLISTILSAQCTDKQVNKVTPLLFQKYPSAKELGLAEQYDIENIIRSTGFFKNKSKNIITASKDISLKYNGKVPNTIISLTSLAGVGRKTANVVLGNAFNLNYGVVVDTHVSRITQRLLLTENSTPEKIEQDLMKRFDSENWTLLSHLLIFHGRSLCKAQNPNCLSCFLKMNCVFFNSKKNKKTT